VIQCPPTFMNNTHTHTHTSPAASPPPHQASTALLLCSIFTPQTSPLQSDRCHPGRSLSLSLFSLSLSSLSLLSLSSLSLSRQTCFGAIVAVTGGNEHDGNNNNPLLIHGHDSWRSPVIYSVTVGVRGRSQGQGDSSPSPPVINPTGFELI